jgi:hypothetical protein
MPGAAAMVFVSFMTACVFIGAASASDAAAAAASAAPDLKSRLRGAFFGSLVGDALCLGSHYEYDALTIKQVRCRAPRVVVLPMSWRLVMVAPHLSSWSR